ncbi:MAG: hypothetical protein HC809_05985 [Gammaproteobacteria bacterium]|nr:hypothetical protein [Gammaproteobacteria bacterium]
MPIDFAIEPERRRVVSRCFGVLAARDMSEHQDAIAADPTFEPEFSQLFDLTEVERIDVDRAATIALARRSPFSPDARTAVVATSALAVGLSRVFGAMVHGGRRDLQVFDNVAAALQWLATEE